MIVVVGGGDGAGDGDGCAVLLSLATDDDYIIYWWNQEEVWEWKKKRPNMSGTKSDGGSKRKELHCMYCTCNKKSQNWLDRSDTKKKEKRNDEV